MSAAWASQAVLLPVILPLLAGALLILVDERRQGLKLLINAASCLTLLLVALQLSLHSDRPDAPGMTVQLAANWPAPFGIALAADRLSAAMLLLTAVLALVSLLYAYSRWSRVGLHFHPLFQFLLMGINGAFLTADLFNLFVFFEVMLAASYGLLLYSYNGPRIRAGLQYVAINLLCSFFFLIGVALIYAASGTLNFAHLAQLLPQLGSDDRLLLEIGAAVLAIAFLAKAAAWPFCFWLPAAYSQATPPVGAMFVLMTKVGVYVVLRLWLLLFSPEAGASSGFGAGALTLLGLITLVFGSFGLLASQELGRMASYSAIVSTGILLSALGLNREALIGPALYYLISSTLAVAALLLLVELIERMRDPVAALLAVTMEAYAVEEGPEETAGVVIPAALAFLGLGFVMSTLLISGLPPLSGFVAKFGLLHALLLPGAPDAAGLPLAGWGLLILLLVSGMAALIALMRFGVRSFWAAAVTAPSLRVSEAAAVGLLLLLTLLLTVLAGPVQAYLERSAAALQRPAVHIEAVLSAPVVPGPGEENGP